MRQRAMSAAVLVPVVGIPFLLGNPWLTIGIALLAFLGAIEAVGLIRKAGLPADPGIPILLAPIAVLATLDPRTVPVVIAFSALAIGAAAVASFRRTDLRAGFQGWAGGAFGATWISMLAFVPLIMLAAPALPASSPLLGRLDPGRTWLLCLVLTVWACDTFAYLVGRTYPRGRMLPTLSPNKTWSGGIGGTVAAILVAAVLFSTLAGVNLLSGALIGAVVAVAGQIGDAAESLAKRAAGVKDSGRIMPGHGGVLDRVDSILFAGPALFLVMSLVPGLSA